MMKSHMSNSTYDGGSFNGDTAYSAWASSDEGEGLDPLTSMHRWLTRAGSHGHRPSITKSSDTFLDTMSKPPTRAADLHQDNLRSSGIVVRATVVTLLGLCGLLFTIMVVPLPTASDHCYGCCSNPEPCDVRAAPQNLLVLGEDELAVNSQLSSGWEHLGIQRDHSCYCSAMRENQIRDEDVKSLTHDFVFRVEDEESIPYSSFSNVLDEDPETEWCSLPHTDQTNDDDTNSPMGLVTFPQYLTFLTTQSGDHLYAKGAQIMIPYINQCGARRVQWQAGAASNSPWQPILWFNLTSEVNLCCSSAWQYIPFNSTEFHDRKPMTMSYYFRLLLYTSFGNPHRISVAGVNILAAPNKTLALAPSLPRESEN